MLRYIANRFAGKRKSADESLSISEAIELLERWDSSTRGNITYTQGLPEFSLSGVALGDMVNFVEDNFNIRRNYYIDVEHQIYSGKSGDKHYLELAYGEIKGRFGATEVKGSPFRRATIDFLVQEE